MKLKKQAVMILVPVGAERNIKNVVENKEMVKSLKQRGILNRIINN